MTTDTEHQERTWRLAKAERTCRICEGTGVAMTPDGERASSCKSCWSTGRVPCCQGYG